MRPPECRENPIACTSIAIPFADVRGFLDDEGSRLQVPQWPFPKVGEEFVRGFGLVRKRRRGGFEQWVGEDSYCSAAQALRFRPPLERQPLGSSQVRCCAKGVFRRFYNSGGPVTRFELGLKITPVKRSGFPLDASEFLHLLSTCLGLRVEVPCDHTAVTACDLFSVGRNLAKHYLKSTTKRTKGISVAAQTWWFSSGDPLLIVEHGLRDISALPRGAKVVRRLEFADLALSHCWMDYGARVLGVWFVFIGRNADRDVLRRLRVHLFRIHSEIEALKQVFRTIAHGQVSPSVRGEQLQQYLNESTRFLSCNESYGFRQEKILDVALELGNIISPGDREALLTQLIRIRPTILRKIELLASPKAQFTARAGSVQIINVDQVGDRMNKNVTVTGDGNIVNLADYMANVTNVVHQNVDRSSAGADTKELIKALMESVKQISPSVEPALAKQMGDDVRTLSEELARPQPRKKWYDLSLQGIKEAAEAVGEIGKPILAIVAKLLPLAVGA